MILRQLFRYNAMFFDCRTQKKILTKEESQHITTSLSQVILNQFVVRVVQ